MNIKNKIIVITGAGQGLGKSFALDLAKKKAKLALIDINTDQLENIKEECTSIGAETKTYNVDISKEDQVVNFFDNVIEDFGSLDVLVNNAGVTRDGLIVRNKDGKIKKMSLENQTGKRKGLMKILVLLN